MNLYFQPYRTVLQGIAYAIDAYKDNENAEEWFKVESRFKLEKFILDQRSIIGERRFYFIAGEQLMSFWSEVNHKDSVLTEFLQPVVDMIEELIFSDEK